MKLFALLILSIAVALTRADAAQPKSEFVRKPGVYSLDSKGSTLTIKKEPAGSWSLKVDWRSRDATSSAVPEDSLRAEGWFVFVENPGRIWVFDGIDQALLLSHTEKETISKTLSRADIAAGPQKFREALPEKLREKNSRTQGADASSRARAVTPGTSK